MTQPVWRRPGLERWRERLPLALVALHAERRKLSGARDEVEEAVAELENAKRRLETLDLVVTRLEDEVEMLEALTGGVDVEEDVNDG